MKPLLLNTIVATFSIIAAAQQPKAVQITNGPVIESIAQNSATLAWSTNTGGSSVVKYGTDSNNLNQTAESPYVTGSSAHRVVVKGLQPNTAYYFQVVSGQGEGTGTEAHSPVLPARTPERGTLIPLYRLVNGPDHLFTTNYQEAQKAVSGGFKMERSADYIAQNQIPGTVPLYRLFSKQSNDHFYTTKPSERDSASKAGYVSEGIAGYVASSALPNTVALHRLLSANGKTHFYTSDRQEVASDQTVGWKDEGVQGYIWNEGQR